jgi:hypothetical protein
LQQQNQYNLHKKIYAVLSYKPYQKKFHWLSLPLKCFPFPKIETGTDIECQPWWLQKLHKNTCFSQVKNIKERVKMMKEIKTLECTLYYHKTYRLTDGKLNNQCTAF